MSQKIFISYRRVDSEAWSGRIYDRLSGEFGESEIFMDVDTIGPGLDFVSELEKALKTCSILIAIIGLQWVSITDKNGVPRLQDPKDFVRLEIAAALRRNIFVVPVLVGGASMPIPDELPDDLKPLTRKNAMMIRHDTFGADIKKLIYAIKSGIETAGGNKPVPSNSKPSLLNVAQEIYNHARDFLVENEEILSPLFVDETVRDEVYTNMVNLYNIQRNRGNFGRWKAVLSLQFKNETDDNLRNLINDLLDNVNHLYNAFYSEKPFFDGPITKQMVINKLTVARALKKIENYEQVIDIVNSYLQYLRVTVENIGNVLGKLESNPDDANTSKYEHYLRDPKVGEGVMKPNMTGIACENLRTCLRRLGYKVKFGNQYDNELAEVVIQFQIDYKHSSVDGYFGPGTRRLLLRKVIEKHGVAIFSRMEKPD